MLEGKAKELFEDYLKDILDFHYSGFYTYPPSMQWGVIQDWADSVGIYITLIPNWKKGIRTYRVGIHHEFGGIIDSLFLRPEKDSPFFIEYDTRQAI